MKHLLPTLFLAAGMTLGTTATAQCKMTCGKQPTSGCCKSQSANGCCKSLADGMKLFLQSPSPTTATTTRTSAADAISTS